MAFPNMLRSVLYYIVLLYPLILLHGVSASISTLTPDMEDVTDNTTTVRATASTESNGTTTASMANQTSSSSPLTTRTTAATTSMLLPVSVVFSTLDTTAAQSSPAPPVGDANTELLSVQFYYGIGMGAGVCLIVGLSLFLILKQCRRGKDSDSKHGNRCQQEHMQKRDDTGNLYETAVGPPDPSTYDLPDEEGQINASALCHHRIPSKAKVKRKDAIQTHTSTTAEVVSYDEVKVEREDNPGMEYEEIPRSYRKRKVYRPSLAQVRSGERPATPEKARRPRVSRKKKGSAEKKRHIDPSYVNQGSVNHGYVDDTGNEAGYLPMNQLRVATVTETYVDMAQDYVRPRRQDTRKSKDDDDDDDDDDDKPVHDYINVMAMDIAPPSQRNSDQPLLDRDSKGSNKKRKWGLKYFSDETNVKFKSKFPFFKRTSKEKDRSSNREASCLYDDAIGTGSNQTSQLCVSNLEQFGATGSRRETESEDDTSECSHTTDSLCNEMMADTLESL